DVAADPQQPGPAPKQEFKGYLITVLLIGLAITLLVALALGFLLHKRGGIARPALTDAAATSVSFACPKCTKFLKTKADRVGKKVKCPKCGFAVLVPSSEAGDARGASL